MTYDYFYGQQADQFSFYRIPKALFTDDTFDGITTDAKLTARCKSTVGYSSRK